MNAAVIFLQAIGPVDAQVIAYLKDNLSCFWSVEILPGIEVPQESYHQARKQYEGSALLRALSDRETPVLGVTEVDAFVDGLNYIFGLAIGRRAMISLKRLRPEFYGLAEDDELLNQRVQKEAIHELGHVFGINHCLDQNCVMYFSNSILDTDFKDWRYCGRCEWKAMR